MENSRRPQRAGKEDMEPERVPLNEIMVDPLAQELVRSEQSRPYTDYWMNLRRRHRGDQTQRSQPALGHILPPHRYQGHHRRHT
jgi:hypothetical protein